MYSIFWFSDFQTEKHKFPVGVFSHKKFKSLKHMKDSGVCFLHRHLQTRETQFFLLEHLENLNRAYSLNIPYLPVSSI